MVGGSNAGLVTSVRVNVAVGRRGHAHASASGSTARTPTYVQNDVFVRLTVEALRDYSSEGWSLTCAGQSARHASEAPGISRMIVRDMLSASVQRRRDKRIAS